MAAIYNVSLNYLVGFVKKEKVIHDGLTDEQCQLIFMLVKELKESTKPKDGVLSSEQQNILNRIMREFSR